MRKVNILVTGGAGFIGSNLVEALLEDGRVGVVRVLDNLSTGFLDNLESFQGNEAFEFLEGDIRDYETCLKACQGMDLVSHQAALGSVSRSIIDPLATHAANATGTLNVFMAAKEWKIKRVVYAASSSTYGDSQALPKVEDRIGNPLTPYAVTKYVMELYAKVFGDLYGVEFIGLRYFNVFGPKQNPNGQYAAVIPIFITHVLNNQTPSIFGDGTTSRDFTYIDNVVYANVLAMTTSNQDAINNVYNVAYGTSTSLNTLFELIKKQLHSNIPATFKPERNGDIKNSLANINKAKQKLNYTPLINIETGLVKTIEWYKHNIQL